MPGSGYKPRDLFTRGGTPLNELSVPYTYSQAQTDYNVWNMLRSRNRFIIVQFLRQHGGKVYVGQMAYMLQMQNSTVSQTLRLLLAVQMVTVESDGAKRYYALNEAVVSAIEQRIRELFN